MNTPDMMMPTQVSERLVVDRAPKGRTWNTRDWTTCSRRVVAHTRDVAPSRIRGRDCTMNLPTGGKHQQQQATS